MPVTVADQRDLADGLRPIEAGALWLLQLAAWDRPDTALIDDDAELARITRLDIRTWRRMRETVLGRFDQLDDGRWQLATQRAQRAFVEDRLEAAEQTGTQECAQTCKQVSSDSNGLPGITPTTFKKTDSNSPLSAGLIAALARKHGAARVERVRQAMRGREVQHPVAYALAALRNDQRERPDGGTLDPVPDNGPSRPTDPPIELVRLRAGSTMATGSSTRAEALLTRLGTEMIVALVRRCDRGEDSRSLFLAVERAALAAAAGGSA